MTGEEVARYALVLSEAERIRAQIAEDEAAAEANGGHELPLLVALPTVEGQPAVVAA